MLYLIFRCILCKDRLFYEIQEINKTDKRKKVAIFVFVNIQNHEKGTFHPLPAPICKHKWSFSFRTNQEAKSSSFTLMILDTATWNVMVQGT